MDGRGTVVLGVTGSIAAYKAAEITSQLKKQGVDVFVVMTEAACQFITPLTLESLSHHAVATDLFSRETPWEIEHIALAKRADIFLVAPATANCIAKLAHGIADDLLSTTLMATEAPIFIAPAMNTVMYQSAANQANMALLRERGCRFVDPSAGVLACGDTGKGKLAPVEQIVQAVLDRLEYDQGIEIKTPEQLEAILLAEVEDRRREKEAAESDPASEAEASESSESTVPEEHEEKVEIGAEKEEIEEKIEPDKPEEAKSSIVSLRETIRILREEQEIPVELPKEQPLAGMHVLISAGPTREKIDPVRYISNRSSGRMGYALAEQAVAKGAKVTLVSGPVALTAPEGANCIDVETTQDMNGAMQAAFSQCDICIMAAAPADFSPKRPMDQKIKKVDFRDGQRKVLDDEGDLTLELGSTEDILGALTSQKEHQFICGFAAETHNLDAYACEKLRRKRLDMIVANDVSRRDIGFDSKDNEVVAFFADGTKKALSKASKTKIASEILDLIALHLES